MLVTLSFLTRLLSTDTIEEEIFELKVSLLRKSGECTVEVPNEVLEP
jgi:hypothetical protein